MGYGLDLVKGVGSSAAGSIVSEGLGLLTQGLKNRQQLKQAGRLQDLEIKGSKEMMDYSMAKQLQMWKDTSYGAQVEQMKEANINPGLMYGMGGGGGQTTGSAGGGVSGQSAGTADAAMGLNLAMIESQRRNMDADTKVKEAQAAKISGVDTDVARATTASLLQGVSESQAKTALTNVQSDIQKLDLKFNDKTFEFRVSQINYEVSKINEEISILETQKKLDRATAEVKGNILKAELANKVMDTYLKAAQKRGVDQSIQESAMRIEKMINDIAISWAELNMEERRTRVLELNEEWDHSGLPPMVKDVIESITDFIPGKGLGGGKGSGRNAGRGGSRDINWGDNSTKPKNVWGN